ncbi:MAG: prephenate dehydrogenase/arogenate dehydrogenase family protein [Oscillospiraceae bacterium]|nr:prephenate dehydrogenase/arogenate dehydrogenase family protein [Oscillospiraceae bacterium]
MTKPQTIGIVGLGLIGGSLAKAYQRVDGVRVLGADRDTSIMEFARLAQAVDEELTDENIAQCELLLLATYPQGVIDWVTAKAAKIAKDAVVIDCTGTKKRICDALFPVAAAHGFVFVGGHPMAGTHQSGFKHSREDLFDDAPMVIVPPTFGDIQLFERVNRLLKPIGFGRVSMTTAEEHDEIIAFTSQMPHIISNAYIKSRTAARHKGYSAGSYRDLSRVAWLNADMWSELFVENRDALLDEMDEFIYSLKQYRDALKASDSKRLWALLEEGRRRKKEVDGP